MKVILLFLIIVNLLIIKGSIVNLFKSKEQINKELIESFEKLEEQFNYEKATNLLFVCVLLFIIFNSITYVLAAIYIKTFWFVLVSIILFINNWKELSNFTEWINNKNEVRLNRLTSLVQILYIGYLIYYLFITW